MGKESRSSTPVADPELFVVQNITLGYHCVSDIKLQFEPRQIIDLTWEDPNIIHKSRNLKDSLRSGVLKRLSPEEYEKTVELQYQREKKQLEREQQKQQQAAYTKQKTTEGKDMLAETFDVDKVARKVKEDDPTIGMANNPMSYVTAFEIAQNMATDQGDVLTAEEFANMVEGDPNIVPKLLKQTRASTAELETRHTAYYAMPDSPSGVAKTKMTNFNRDHRFAGEHDLGVADRIKSSIDLDINAEFDDDIDFAEEIDIENEIKNEK